LLAIQVSLKASFDSFEQLQQQCHKTLYGATTKSRVDMDHTINLNKLVLFGSIEKFKRFPGFEVIKKQMEEEPDFKFVDFYY
jgi:hypothetical protein